MTRLVKIFFGDASNVEAELNKWLEEHKDITILHVLQSSGEGIRVVISVLYKPEHK